jgi:hypothetical protein
LFRTRNGACIRVEAEKVDVEVGSAGREQLRGGIEQGSIAARRIENAKSGAEVDSTTDSLREKLRERQRRVMDAGALDPPNVIGCQRRYSSPRFLTERRPALRDRWRMGSVLAPRWRHGRCCLPCRGTHTWAKTRNPMVRQCHFSGNHWTHLARPGDG